MAVLRRCSMSRRCLWLAVPLVAGHFGCLALPAATLAVGVPILMPICGGGYEAVAVAGATGRSGTNSMIAPDAAEIPPQIANGTNQLPPSPRT